MKTFRKWTGFVGAILKAAWQDRAWFGGIGIQRPDLIHCVLYRMGGADVLRFKLSVYNLCDCDCHHLVVVVHASQGIVHLKAMGR
jgi:hypothetical protein